MNTTSEQTNKNNIPPHKSYPIDFEFIIGQDDHAVIYIDDASKGDTHHLKLTNTSTQDIQLGISTQDNHPQEPAHHFELRFRAKTLSTFTLNNIAIVESGWEISQQKDERTVSLYFLFKEQTLKIDSGKSITLTLQNISADGGGGARGTRVELRYPQLISGESSPISGHREKHLNIVNHRGKQHIPLHVGFVGSNRILNDGETPNELILRIVNVLKDKSILLIPASKGDEASKFIISFDVQEEKEKKDWALLETGQVAGISVKHEAQEIINSGKQGESPEWVITFKDQIAIEPGQDIKVELLGIKSSLSSGQANLYLRYENIPGYWDGQFVIILEKAPILYRNGNVGIGEGNPSQKLQVSGGNAAINNVFVGDVIHSLYWAGFSHIDAVGTNSYALLQDRSGTFTLINKKSGGGHIGFRVDNTDKMVIDDKGNVAIGEGTPSEKLQVFGGNAAINNVFLGDVDNPSEWASFSHIEAKGSPSYALRQNRSGTTTLINKKSGDGYIGFRVANADKMVIDDKGNVGIGVVNPSQKLQVVGGNAVINNVFLGDVGHSLHWAGFSHINAVGTNSYALLQDRSGNNTLINKNSGDGYIGFRVANADKMVIVNNGNVGIGTTTPTAMLDVNGVVRAKSFESTNPLRHRMYPDNPKVYQDIFEAEKEGAIAKLGTPQYDATSWTQSNPYHDLPIIKYGGNSEADGNGAVVTIPDGYDTVWVRVLGDRWNVIKAYFLDSGADLGFWTGGHRAANCYCPDGSLSDSYRFYHQWLPIPAGRAGQLALIAKPNTNDGFWLSGVAFSKNPWAHAVQSAVGYHWAINGGQATEFPRGGENWNEDILSIINPKTNLELKVPVVPSGRDKLLYLVEHNNNWNGCMHNGITVNGTPIERFLASYDNPFARHWNSKLYERYIAACIPAKLIPSNNRYLTVRIDRSKQDEGMFFREIGTHDLEIPQV